MFLDGSVWTIFPNNYTLKSITFNYDNAQIKSRIKESVYSFSYSNETRDDYTNRLITNVNKDIEIKLKHSSGLYLKDTDQIYSPIPKMMSTSLNATATNFDVFMHVNNLQNYELKVESDYILKPYYKNE